MDEMAHETTPRRDTAAAVSDKKLLAAVPRSGSTTLRTAADRCKVSEARAADIVERLAQRGLLTAYRPLNERGERGEIHLTRKAAS